MRKPTSRESAYAWWTAALAGKKPPIHQNEPQVGFFMRKLLRAGPFVPASISWEGEVDPTTGELLGPEVMVCEVNGQPRDPLEEWTWLAGRPISEEQYLEMLAARFGAPAAQVAQEGASPQKPEAAAARKSSPDLPY